MIKTTLLTSGNAKILKGEKLGYITKGIHLAPANLSGYETCRWRSKGCTMSCLNTAGRGQMNTIQDSRIAKTKLFFEQRLDFLAKLSKEIASTIKSAKKKEMEAVFRPRQVSRNPILRLYKVVRTHGTVYQWRASKQLPFDFFRFREQPKAR